jgi:hypothetical protein
LRSAAAERPAIVATNTNPSTTLDSFMGRASSASMRARCAKRVKRAIRDLVSIAAASAVGDFRQSAHF